jgi:mRNA interferase RelE/StbE
MADYSIVFARSARKELEALPEAIALRILARIESLAEDPRPRGCLKLSGSDNLWRIRVGDYRVVFSINDPDLLIDVIAVRHRRDAYS